MKEHQLLWQERIVADRRILAGKPVIKGTRISVDFVLEELSHDPDIGQLLIAHPELTRDDVRACLSYARDIVAGERIHSLKARQPPLGVLIATIITIALIAILLIYVKQW